MNQQNTSTSSTAYAAIRAMIEQGQLLPGSALSERSLAESLDLGRTPVREAIKELTREGILVSVPLKGTFVQRLTITDLKEIHEVRLALEGMAAKLAAEKGGSEELRGCREELLALPAGPQLDTYEAQRVGWNFHRAMFQAAGNRRLLKLYEDVRMQNSLAMQRVKNYDPERTRVVISEHIAICDAILDRNQALASQRIWEHLQKAMEAKLHSLVAVLD
jgi:DNA-binding GntR family transcriptional regulator